MEDCGVGRLLERRLADWSGLGEGCREADLARSLPLREGEGMAHLGSGAEEYRFRVMAPPGFVDAVFLYFRGDVLALVRTDYWSLDAAECAALLEALGEPEHRMELVWKNDAIPDGDRVWPGRGIALGVIPETGIVVRVALFPPCTLADYEARYRSTEPVREFRERD